MTDDQKTLEPDTDDAATDDASYWAEFAKDEEQTAAKSDDGAEGAPEEAGDTWEAEEEQPGHDQEEEPAPQEAAGDTKAGNGQDGDIWANATDEQRAAWQAAQHENQSHRGRLSAMQRKMDQLQAQLQNQTPAADKAAGGDEGHGGTADADNDVLSSEQWKSLREEYPEIATPLQGVIEGLNTKLTRATKTLEAIGTDRQQEALVQQEQTLAQEHPDWNVIAADREFSDWVYAQPRHIIEAAERNGNGIVDAAEAADLIGRFKDHRSRQGASGAAANPSAQGKAGNGRSSTSQQQPTALSNRRQRQLESASTTRSRGPAALSGIPEDGDPEQIWRAMEKAGL